MNRIEQKWKVDFMENVILSVAIPKEFHEVVLAKAKKRGFASLSEFVRFALREAVEKPPKGRI